MKFKDKNFALHCRHLDVGLLEEVIHNLSEELAANKCDDGYKAAVASAFVYKFFMKARAELVSPLLIYLILHYCVYICLGYWVLGNYVFVDFWLSRENLGVHAYTYKPDVPHST